MGTSGELLREKDTSALAGCQPSEELILQMKASDLPPAIGMIDFLRERSHGMDGEFVLIKYPQRSGDDLRNDDHSVHVHDRKHLPLQEIDGRDT